MFSDYLWILPALPALGALINGLAGAGWSEKRNAVVAAGSVGLALIFAFLVLYDMLSSAAPACSLSLYRWLSNDALQINIGFVLDRLAMVMVMVILFLGFLIHVYSIGYMKGEKGYRRYFVCLNMFVFFMLVLVLADNLVFTFVGWEGVGLCSYLLIGFWHEKASACNAGRKAFVVNRIGDFGFLLGIMTAVVTFGSVNYSEIMGALAGGSSVPQSTLTAVCLLLFMGAMGKSAQFPLHVWLPDAMEGPTPVSALIHAATMVNAGVYLMCRISPLLEAAPQVLPVIAAVGLATAVYASLSALGQSDIKRVLAYSTVSQIGYMFVALGCGLYAAGMFHLLTHGIFKGLLFLGAGAIIHALQGEQRISRMGGLIRELPATATAFMAGLLALAGIFPFSGFVSKDAILWGGFERYGFFFWSIAFGGAVVTALYTGKLFSALLGNKGFETHIHRPGKVMVVPLLVLAVSALLAGIPGLPLFSSDTIFARFLGMTAGISPEAHATAQSVHTLELTMAIAQSLVLIAVLAGAIKLFTGNRQSVEPAQLAGGFGIDAFFNIVFVHPLKSASRFSAATADKAIDGAVNGLAALSMAMGRLASGMQTGQMRHYAVLLIAGAFILIAVTICFAGGF
jgi:NADH-quinone oxidoreductase subunit L